MKADIGDRLLKIDQLKKRYELSMDLLGKNDDGTTVTAVQIKIEMAQEKYLLLNEGNELNEKILKAEKEQQLLQNTLQLMNFSNDEYRKIFETITESSPEVKRMNELQNNYFATTSKLKKLKEDLVLIIDHIQLLEQQRLELVREYDEVIRTKLDNNDALLKCHKELIDQETKLERADREMKTAFKAAKKRIKDQEFVVLFEKDMTIKERDDRNNSSLQQLADLVETTPDMSQTVTRHFLERGLSLPANVRRAKSQCSWKSETSIGDSLKGDVHCMKRCKFPHFRSRWFYYPFPHPHRFASLDFVWLVHHIDRNFEKFRVQRIGEDYSERRPVCGENLVPRSEESTKETQQEGLTTFFMEIFVLF